jgi:hypothetical protein
MIRLGECSCRYNEHIRGHTAVRSVHQEDLIIELESQSCAQNVRRHGATAMKNQILIASTFLLQRFLDMLWGI